MVWFTDMTQCTTSDLLLDRRLGPRTALGNGNKGDNVGFMVEIEPSEYSQQLFQHPARNLPLVKRMIVRVELRPENFPGPIRM
jgi:hypothetical protein